MSDARRGGVSPGGGQSAEVGSGSTSLLLALLSAASSAGSWCAVIGVPTLGALAAAESGIALDRLALVPNPGPEWPTVVAALIDGVDVVVLAVPGQVSPSITSRLVARARQRGCVLVPYGRWDGADVTLQVTQGRWEGLGEGHGRLRRRMVTVIARGRGAAARPKEVTMWMPGFGISPPPPPAPEVPDPVPHDPERDGVPSRTSDPAAPVSRIPGGDSAVSRAPGRDGRSLRASGPVGPAYPVREGGVSGAHGSDGLVARAPGKGGGSLRAAGLDRLVSPAVGLDGAGSRAFGRFRSALGISGSGGRALRALDAPGPEDSAAAGRTGVGEFVSGPVSGSCA